MEATSPAHPARPLIALLVAAATLCSALAAPAAASAQKPGGPLSVRLQALAGPDLRAASAAEQADAVSLLPRGPGSLLRDGGALIVEVGAYGRATNAVPALRRAGAEIVNVSSEYETVTVSVQERNLRAIAALAGVENVQEVITPMTGAGGPSGTAAARGTINTCGTGVVTEGNAQLKAGSARTRFDVDGTGVDVGVLSDSYDTSAAASTHAAGDISSGNLPGPANPCGRTAPVSVLEDSPGPESDEGRAMLQIVHDLAPGSRLKFATAFTGETAFADNIRDLADAGAEVIVDDVAYFAEPFYQDGVVANAIEDVTDEGVSYFTMAFNNDGHGVNSYEAPAYRSTSCPPVIAALPGPDDCMDFDPGAGADNSFDVNVSSGDTFLSLNWAEAQQGVATDLDFYLLNPSAGTISFTANGDNFVTQKPFEFLSGEIVGAGARQIVIHRYSGTATPRLKFISNDNGANRITSTQPVVAPDVQGPTIYGHNGAASAQTIAAVPFFNAGVAEPYSSRGPATNLFGPVQPAGAAAPLTAPEVRSKPDVAATDGGLTSFFGPGNRFYGTSAAAPHAAAVAALQISANEALGPAQVKSAQRSTARAVGSAGPLEVGAGLIDAEAAIAANPPAPPTVSISSGPTGPTTTAAPVFNFTVAGKAKTVTCSFEGAAAQPCSSPFTAPQLGDGENTLTVAATDYFGRSGAETRSFSVDTTGPATKFGKRPKKRTTKKRARFTFSASEAGSSFECKLDRRRFKDCSSPVKVRVREGKHRFSVRATDPLGNTGAAKRRSWTFEKKRRR